MKDFKKDC